jgi:hypothetical protein
LLRENRNSPKCLYVYETRTTADGKQSKKLYLRRNRAGNPHTIGLSRVIAELENKHKTAIDHAMKTNLDALTESRDNAVHFVNAGLDLYKQVLEIGTATIRNYVTAIRNWFGRDLSQYSFFLMPLGFIQDRKGATALTLSPNERNLVKYLAGLAATGENDASTDYHVSLSVNLSFKRSNADAATTVAVTNDPNAPRVTLSEEDIRSRYPWDYSELTKRLSKRYIDFKANKKYHSVRKPLMSDLRYVNRRYLDPGNPRSAAKDWYNSNVLQIFDQHYTRKN